MLDCKFIKMNGLGNDFAIFDLRDQSNSQCIVSAIAKHAQLLSDRYTGIGADQILLILPSTVADAKMVIINRDGSFGKACGNGTRCIAKLLNQDKSTIEVDNRVLHIHKEGQNFCVQMGTYIHLLSMQHLGYNFHSVDVGNPHIITFDMVAQKQQLAMAMQQMFTEGVNVSFAEVIDKQNINLTVYERGSGFTLACGSAATATFAMAVQLGLVAHNALVHFKLGALTMQLDPVSQQISQSGPAAFNFDGSVSLEF